MDGYRGNESEIERAVSGPRGDDLVGCLDPASPDSANHDDIGHEPPPLGVGQDERRMQVRAYNYWASLLGDCPFPQIDDVTAAALPDFADHAVVLDFSAGITDPAVTMLGAQLAGECGAATTIRHVSDVPGRSLLSRITDHYMQILANAAPIGFEAEFVNHCGNTLIYRGILLPFSSDGASIQHIMGVINWKEVADPYLTAELILELEDAADEGPSPFSSQQLGAWADGPVAARPVEQDPAAQHETAAIDPELADWLALARESAAAVDGLEDRSRSALYAAIGRAWDFALAAAADPPAFQALIVAAGLVVRARAPMTPVAKLVFGAGYDKTRLAEVATALAHARRLGMARGMLADFLGATPGGLKGVVRAERRLHRLERGTPAAVPDANEKLAVRLRELPNWALQDLAVDGSEFAVVLIRRLADGDLRLLGELGEDFGMIGRVARKLGC